MSRILIFTEAGTKIGLGHLTRCSSLYDAAIDRGYDCMLIVYSDLDEMSQLGDRKHLLIDWKDTDYIKSNVGNTDYCIIDSYLADYNIYSLISNQAKSCIFIDDTARIAYPKEDIVVNPSLYPYDLYELSQPSNDYLLGSKYIILREPFVKIADLPIKKTVENVLIIMGGSDIRNMTLQIASLICPKYPDLVFHIVSNSSDDYYKHDNIHLYSNLDAISMAKLMKKTDLAVTAAGQTIYELIAANTSIIPIKMIDNQKNNIKGLISNSLINNYIDYDDADFDAKLINEVETMLQYENRIKFLNNYTNLIDGLGSKRIINYLIKDVNLESVHIRNASQSDCHDIYKLSNAKYVRDNSISKEPITWENHINWFNDIINSDTVVFHVVTDDLDNFLGQVRYKLEKDHAVVSISICKQILGKGVSQSMLVKSLDAFRQVSNAPIKAVVMKQNTPSVKLFTRAGFTQDGESNGYYNFILKESDV